MITDISEAYPRRFFKGAPGSGSTRPAVLFYVGSAGHGTHAAGICANHGIAMEAPVKVMQPFSAVSSSSWPMKAAFR